MRIIMDPLSHESSHLVVSMNGTGERQVLIGAVHAEPVCQAPRHSYGSTECSLLDTRPADSSLPMHRTDIMHGSTLAHQRRATSATAHTIIWSILPSLLMPTVLLIPSCHPLLWLIEKTGSLRVEERNPSISEEDAALSRDATEKRRRNRPLYRCCSYLVSLHHHVDRHLLPSLALETSCTANACTMGLQCEPAAPAHRRRDVRDRAMP